MACRASGVHKLEVEKRVESWAMRDQGIVGRSEQMGSEQFARRGGDGLFDCQPNLPKNLW